MKMIDTIWQKINNFIQPKNMDSELNCNDNNDCADNFYDHDIDLDQSYDYEHEEETLSELYQHCIAPSVHGTVQYMIPLFLLVLLFKLLTQLIKLQKTRHAISFISGICVLQYYVPQCFYVLLVFVTLSYLFLMHARKYNPGIITFVPSLVMILFCEFTMTPSIWHKIRGVVMIIVMKIISITIDNSDQNQQQINLYEYSGYVFCPVTCFFGPWVSFKDYINLPKQLSWNRKCYLTSAVNLVLALCFLSSSNCLVPWVLSDNNFTNLPWLIAYRDALTFRTSHYFVSYMATSIMILGGFPETLATVTRPLETEIPRSLVQVVINWNVPMHYWLKTYVFRPARIHLGRFGAIFTTYLASSLLHGLNFQLAAVLLSLGFYTYVEFQLRMILSEAFDACVASKPCVNYKCIHSKKNNWWVIFINIGFSVLSIFHLAYLGLMFDTSELQETGYNYNHTIAKWSQFGFVSHWVAFATYCIYFLVR